MGWRVAILLVVCACDRVFFLDHIAPPGDGATGDVASNDGVTSDGGFDCAGFDFCDPFDRPPPVATGWDGQFLSGGGQIVLTSANSVSPPNALDVQFANSASEAYLAKTLPAPATSLVVDFDFSLATSDPAEVDLMVLKWTPPPSGCSRVELMLVVRQNPRQLALQETYICTAGGIDYHEIGTLTDTAFHHAHIEVTLGNPGMVRATVTGVGTVTAAPNPPLGANPIELQVGAAFISASISSPWRVLFDNVTAKAD